MRILLVEDDSRIAAFVAKGLRDNSYAVDIASDAEETTYMAAMSSYDLVILDVNLPSIDGYEVCRELREKGNNKPILMLTTRDAINDRISGLDTGADDYLIKPFEVRELRARLRALLRRHGEVRMPKIIIDNLEIDTISQNVSRGGIQIDLTAKEYSLIEFLALNKGKILGREEISKHVGKGPELLMPLQWQTMIGKFAVGGDVGYRFKRGPDEMIYGFIVGRVLNKSVEVMGEIHGTGPRVKLGDSEIVYNFGSRIKLTNHANFIFSAGKSIRSNFDPRFMATRACK